MSNDTIRLKDRQCFNYISFTKLSSSEQLSDCVDVFNTDYLFLRDGWSKKGEKVPKFLVAAVLADTSAIHTNMVSFKKDVN